MCDIELQFKAQGRLYLSTVFGNIVFVSPIEFEHVAKIAAVQSSFGDSSFLKWDKKSTRICSCCCLLLLRPSLCLVFASLICVALIKGGRKRKEEKRPISSFQKKEREENNTL